MVSLLRWVPSALLRTGLGEDTPRRGDREGGDGTGERSAFGNQLSAMAGGWSVMMGAMKCNRMVNEVPSVNGVVYEITTEPLGTMEWE